ncbi:eps15 homology domain containing protein-binding protein 1 [Choristoneura fumiferana]|uniref:eps15 homology domain containing protein-binding protein 1 n=1 Tax=Choristoneura fumiferana TaxID=7141 RepID=UPI003D15B2B9
MSITVRERWLKLKHNAILFLNEEKRKLSSRGARMASVWKRLQRVNKRAAKFQYTASYHRVDLDTTPKWKPNKLSIVWTRRSRRVITEPVEWEPSLKDPLKGSVVFVVPANQTVAVTLFKDARTNELEDKDWTFVLEDVSPTGKRRRLAVCALNMRKYASLEPSQRALMLTLEPTSSKIAAAALHLTLHCVLLREGQATDEDMQSLASLLSVNNNSDIAVLEDLDEDDYTLSDNSTRQMSDLRQQMEEMTQSLTNSDIAATPNSVQSLNFDNSRTPTAPLTPITPITPSTPVSDQTPTNDLKIIDTIPKKHEFLNKLTLKCEPKTSTPKVTTPQENFKNVMFKPKMISRTNLKPLELKSNFNSIALDRNENEKDDSDKTPTGEEKLVPGRVDKDKTPVQDLLEWCQAVTAEYKACRVTNLTTSFRSGLALCAIIHRFRPDLIDFSGLQPEESERNLRVALEASATLGISQVLTAADVCKRQPDRLAIMTYLFQLRAHFTGNELQVEQLGNDETESSYLVGRHDTDGSLPRELFSREVATRRSRNLEGRPRPGSQESQVSVPSRQSQERYTPEKSPPRPARLMTRKELTDPFGSDDEDSPPAPAAPAAPAAAPALATANGAHTRSLSDTEPPEPKPKIEPAISDPLSVQDTEKQETEKLHIKETTPELPKPTPQLLSRHDELKERARQLLEATKREARAKEKKRQESKEKDEKEQNGIRNGDLSPQKPMTEEERQQMLRERAKKLIANARAGIISPTSPTGGPRSPRGTVEIISKQSVMDEIAAAGGVEQIEAMLSQSSHSSPGSRHSASPDRSEGSGAEPGARRRSPLHSFTALVENAEQERETGSYIQSELEALEKEQSAIDERAAALEKQLRGVMQSADNTEEEDRLMSQWFNLVNKKNALLRRQMQLNILEQEEDLSRRCELLARELRLSLGVEEWRKTDGQKRRERLLLQELLAAVNERDRLVQEMDEQEKAIADDDAIQRNLSNVEIQRKNNCILQ